MDDDEDDGKPYLVEGGEDRKCPECYRVIDQAAVLCVGCGLDLRKGKKLKQTYAPLERSWDLGIQRGQRRRFFIAGSSLGLVLSLLGANLTEAWGAFLLPWLGFTAMLAFLLGTFFHVTLTRDRKGRVKMTRIWYICFVPQRASEIDVRQYEGVRQSVESDSGFLEWIIFLNLLLCGVLPGVLFFLYVIHMDRYSVMLTRQHGYSDELLYRGTDRKLAEEITAVVRDAARLREEKT